MTTPIDPRGKDNPSQYFVEDRSNEAEMIRQMIQDSTITAGMGGPLPEQADPAALHRILDIGCGPGGWILEAARLYPHMELTGIDISWRMIEYARAQAQAQKLTDGVEFRVMDALHPLEFPDAAFDLVNMRFGFSFLLVKDWPRLLRELLRVCRPGGVVRLTDGTIGQSTSPTFNRINQMFLCALYRSGHHPAEQVGMAHELAHLLSESGCQQVQTRDHPLELVAGTVGGQNFYQDMMYAMQTGKLFIQKWDCGTEEYDALYEQA
ncbi:MAG: class I SAM-dependent methyltransferase, partial [Ktedonobacteraceae bacterium]|nr:class I SAM-dependent methyltransferase [Ktedonobacteraceae bacterium]